MTINNINVEETVQQVANLLAAEQGLSPALKGSLEMLLLLVSLLLSRLGLNSSNSSKPPSTSWMGASDTYALRAPNSVRYKML